MKQFFMDGYICGQVDVRSTSNGKQVTQFSVNSPDRRKNQQTGEWESVAQFFRCQYWHKNSSDFRAEMIKEKAHLVLVGEPKYEEWEKDGQKRNRITFNVQQIFNDAKTVTPAIEPSAEPEMYDEDIPF